MSSSVAWDYLCWNGPTKEQPSQSTLRISAHTRRMRTSSHCTGQLRGRSWAQIQSVWDAKGPAAAPPWSARRVICQRGAERDLENKMRCGASVYDVLSSNGKFADSKRETSHISGGSWADGFKSFLGSRTCRQICKKIIFCWYWRWQEAPPSTNHCC